MAKEAYYFSHDSNARHDPKITAMRSVYGSEGYGWYWMLIEMMREADGYKLEMQGKYTFNAYAMQMHTDCSTAERFVHDCINEFELFQSDGTFFWSDSLIRRMELKDQTSEKRRAAARVRWEKEDTNAYAMQMHSKSNANAMQGKENKRNKKENIYLPESDDFNQKFEEFWKHYPKKQGKAEAFKKMRTYHKQGLDWGKVMQGLNAYINFVEKERERGFNRQFMDGSTFVNQQRWNDDWSLDVSKITKLPDRPNDWKEELGRKFENVNEQPVISIKRA